jgi:hypothetical protein
VILTTTRWGDNRDGHDEARETWLHENVWDPLLRMGASQQRYHGTPDSALGIVQGLLAGSKVVLDIQKEIVDEGKALGETSAGTLVTGNLEDLQAQLQKSLDEIHYLRRQLSGSDEVGRIRIDQRFANDQERMKQAKAAEKLLEERLREEIRAEIEAEVRAQLEVTQQKKVQQGKSSRYQKVETVAKVASSVITVAVAVISALFGLDPGLADVVRGWFQ